MWESILSTSHGRVPVRRIFIAALTTLVVALLWIVLHPQATFAADATWSGSALEYNGNTYNAATTQVVSDLQLAKNTPAYIYLEPAGTANRKLHVLYVAPSTDIKTATQANYAIYTYNGVGNYSNPSPPVYVTLTGGTAGSSSNPGTSSCVVDGGLGWIICPITNTFAGWMDGIFDALAAFLEVRPLELGQDNAMQRAWSYMRTFANIAFVIAFIIIIYSQLTSYGVSNYGIKKLLPRVIVAALLVNLSYIICALAIDISNALGYSIQNIFIQMRNGLVGAEGNTWDLVNFESVASFVLAGGVGAIALGATGVITAITFGPAALVLLLPVLVAGVLAVLVALIIIAGRQAIITILTIIAPLAFVAYLLPNTEKWFEKWRSLFMTMLIFFPAFSLVFGGSQFAASVIIQNAEHINTVILALAVQLAPLYITPLLLKLSGNLLSRIAGIVNNPNKGLIDRTRNFAKDRSEMSKARRLQSPAKSWEIGKRAAQRMDHNRRRREGLKNAYSNRADANWINTSDYSDIEQLNKRSSDEKEYGETVVAKRYANAKIGGDVDIQHLDIMVRNAKAEVDNLNKNVDVQYKNLQANATSHNVIPAHLAAQAVAAQAHSRKAGELDRQLHAADHVRQDEFAEAMAADEMMQKRAGGIDPHGAQTALANAVSTMRSSYNKNVEEARAINKHFNLSGQQRQDLAMGRTFTAEDSHGNKRTFRPDDTFAREAAIEDQLNGQGTVENAIEIIQSSGTTLNEFKTTISSTMASSGFGGKTVWGGGKTIDLVAQGKITGKDDLIQAAAEAIAKGKIATSDLTRADVDGLKIFTEVVKNLPKAKGLIKDPELLAQFDTNLIKFSEASKRAFTTDERENLKENSAKELLQFVHTTDPSFIPPKA